MLAYFAKIVPSLCTVCLFSDSHIVCVEGGSCGHWLPGTYFCKNVISWSQKCEQAFLTESPTGIVRAMDKITFLCMRKQFSFYNQPSLLAQSSYILCQLLVASSPGHSQILSRSHSEKSGEGLGSKLHHGLEMVDR